MTFLRIGMHTGVRETQSFHMSYSRCYIEKKYFGYFYSFKISVSIILKSVIKFLGHILILQFKKILKDMAYFFGSLLFLLRLK